MSVSPSPTPASEWTRRRRATSSSPSSPPRTPGGDRTRACHGLWDHPAERRRDLIFKRGGKGHYGAHLSAAGQVRNPRAIQPRRRDLQLHGRRDDPAGGRRGARPEADRGCSDLARLPGAGSHEGRRSAAAQQGAQGNDRSRGGGCRDARAQRPGAGPADHPAAHRAPGAVHLRVHGRGHSPPRDLGIGHGISPKAIFCRTRWPGKCGKSSIRAAIPLKAGSR